MPGIKDDQIHLLHVLIRTLLSIFIAIISTWEQGRGFERFAVFALFFVILTVVSIEKRGNEK